jgi:hypothetical protein
MSITARRGVVMTDFISNVLLTDTSIIAFIVANLVVFVLLHSKVRALESVLIEQHVALLVHQRLFLEMEKVMLDGGLLKPEDGSVDTSMLEK